MTRPIQATIHVDAMRHNLQVLRQHAPDARVWAVVKANAYGHGIERVFEAARSADGLAVVDIEEAKRLRDLTWRGPILLLQGAFEPRDLEWCSRLDLWHVVHKDEQIDWLATHKTQVGHRGYLKLNSGMNRLGFRAQAFRAAWSRLCALPQVEEVSLMTHFADADRATGLAQPLSTYMDASQGLMGAHCVANSAATLGHLVTSNLPADWIRSGIALYGASPDFPAHGIAHWGLQPVMTLRSEIIATQTLSVGDTVGYGSTFTAQEPMRIGIVACGYADGYPRHAQNAPVLVRGVRTQTVGRISMDMLAVDLRPLDAAGIDVSLPETEVVLWGRSECGAVLPADEVAAASDTIAYELFCALNARVAVHVSD